MRQTQIIILSTFSLLLTCEIHSQGRVQPRELALSGGAVGVVYLLHSDSLGSLVELTFPAEMLRSHSRRVNEHALSEMDTLKAKGDMLIIDSQGIVATLPSMRLVAGLQQWCMNDGGDHLRPTLRVHLKNSVCSRPLRSKPIIDSIVAFVVFRNRGLLPIGRFRSRENKNGTLYHNILQMEASLNPGEQPIARLIEQSYEGMSGCGNALEQNAIVLETSEGRYELRCCGP